MFAADQAGRTFFDVIRLGVISDYANYAEGPLCEIPTASRNSRFSAACR